MSTWTTDDGSTINFESFGANSQPPMPNLLLLPGMLGAIRTQWRKFLQPLSGQFRILLVDLRGHGRSTNEANQLEANQLMADIVGLLDHLKINQFHVAGYDFGGYLGLMLAYHHGRRVQSLIMHGTKFYWTAESAKQMNAQLDPNMIAAKAPSYADQLVQDHGSRQWRHLVRQSADMVHSLVKGGITESMLRNVQTPVLVSVGDRDELVPLSEASRLSRVLPKGELIVLPGVRHPFQSIRFMPLLPMMQEFHTSHDLG
jgi:pimeloyl-ACP methyl ester carboxylesterase